MLLPTPPSQLLDAQGRPYFLWDCELTLAELRDRLASEEVEVRTYWVAKVMRQAKPDDALVLVSADEMRALWERLSPRLGRSRGFWDWLLHERWGGRAR